MSTSINTKLAYTPIFDPRGFSVRLIVLGIDVSIVFITGCNDEVANEFVEVGNDIILTVELLRFCTNLTPAIVGIVFTDIALIVSPFHLTEYVFNVAVVLGLLNIYVILVVVPIPRGGIVNDTASTSVDCVATTGLPCPVNGMFIINDVVLGTLVTV